MACLLQPECNFLCGYFRCWLLEEVVDVEVKITSIQGMHIFQRDRNNTTNKMHPVKHKAPPPYNNQKDENISGGRRKHGSDTSTH